MRLSFFILLVGFALLISTSICVQCICCGVPLYSASFYSSNDTIFRGYGPLPENQLTDTINYYKSKGFTCHIDSTPYAPTAYCGIGRYRRANQAGLICQPEMGPPYLTTACPY